MAFIRKTILKKKKHGRQGEGGGRPKKYTDEWIDNEADVFEAWLAKQAKKPIFWYKEFVRMRGYRPEYISEWGHKNKKFSKVLNSAKALQEEKLAMGGLQGHLNPTLSIFLLKCKHGYNDGNYLKRVQLSGDKDNPIKEEKTIKLDFGTIDEAELKEIDKAVE